MTMLYIVIALAVGFTVLTWLALRSGHGYSVHDPEAHSTNYADVIKEGHGGITLFLWVSFIAIFVWTILLSGSTLERILSHLFRVTSLTVDGLTTEL